MIKNYYVDLIILIIISFISIVLLPHVNKFLYLAIFVIYLIVSLIVNFNFRTVLRFPYEGKLCFTENLGYFLLIFGKIAYAIDLVNVAYANPDKNHDFIVFSLFVFILYSLTFNSTSYIYQNKLIYRLSKVIDLNEIKAYDVKDKYMDIVYLKIVLMDNHKLKLRLSENSYEKLAEAA